MMMVKPMSELSSEDLCTGLFENWEMFTEGEIM